jgi:O-antigen ligase
MTRVSAIRALSHHVHLSCLVCGIVLVPLVNCPSLFIWYDVTPKVAILLSAVGAACLFVPSGSLRHIAGSPKRLGFCLAVVAIYVASTVFSSNPALSVAGSAWRRCGLPVQLSLVIVTALLAASAREPRNALWYLRASSAAFLVASASVVLDSQRLLAIPGWPTALNAARPGGLLGSGAAFGCYAVSALLLSVAHTSMDRARVWRLAGIISCLLGIWAILLCGTRAAILGALVGTAAAVTLCKPRRQLIAVGGITVIALAVAVLGRSAAVAQRIEQVRLDPWGGIRLDVWSDSSALLRHLPLLGYGIETFPRVYPRVQSPETTAKWPLTYFESAHNYFLDQLLSLGMLGLVMVLWASYSVLRILSTIPNPLKLPYRWCFAAYLASLVCFFFFTPQCSALLFMHLPVALLFGAHGNATDGTAGKLGRVAGSAASYCVRLVGLAFIVYGIALAVWDHRVLQAKTLFDAHRTDDAVAAFREARLIAPPLVSAEAWFSRELATTIRPSSSPILEFELYRSLRFALAREEEMANSAVLLAAEMIADGRDKDAALVLEETSKQFPSLNVPRAIMNTLPLQNHDHRTRN